MSLIASLVGVLSAAAVLLAAPVPKEFRRPAPGIVGTWRVVTDGPELTALTFDADGTWVQTWPDRRPTKPRPWLIGGGLLCMDGSPVPYRVTGDVMVMCEGTTAEMRLVRVR